MFLIFPENKIIHIPIEKQKDEYFITKSIPKTVNQEL